MKSHAVTLRFEHYRRVNGADERVVIREKVYNAVCQTLHNSDILHAALSVPDVAVHLNIGGAVRVGIRVDALGQTDDNEIIHLLRCRRTARRVDMLTHRLGHRIKALQHLRSLIPIRHILVLWIVTIDCRTQLARIGVADGEAFKVSLTVFNVNEHSSLYTIDDSTALLTSPSVIGGILVTREAATDKTAQLHAVVCLDDTIRALEGADARVALLPATAFPQDVSLAFAERCHFALAVYHTAVGESDEVLAKSAHIRN